MAKKKYQLPPTMGGLVRYFEEEEVIFKINPKVLIGAIIFIIILELALPRLLF